VCKCKDMDFYIFFCYFDYIVLILINLSTCSLTTTLLLKFTVYSAIITSYVLDLCRMLEHMASRFADD